MNNDRKERNLKPVKIKVGKILMKEKEKETYIKIRKRKNIRKK